MRPLVRQNLNSSLEYRRVISAAERACFGDFLSETRGLGRSIIVRPEMRLANLTDQSYFGDAAKRLSTEE